MTQTGQVTQLNTLTAALGDGDPGGTARYAIQSAWESVRAAHDEMSRLRTAHRLILPI